MGRPKLDPKIKLARCEAARKQAAILNKKKLHTYVYAFAKPSGGVYIRFEPPGGRKVILRSPFPSLDFDRELLAIKGGSIPQVAKRKGIVAAAQIAEPETWRWLCQAYFESKTFKKYSANDQRVRRRVLEKTWDEPLLPNEPEGVRFGDMPVRRFQTKAILTLRDRKARYKSTPTICM